MPEQSVVGVYETLAKAEQAVRELDRQGFPLQQVSIIGHDADRELQVQGDVTVEDEAKQGVRSAALAVGAFGLLAGAVAGAAWGGVLGGLLGWAVSTQHFLKYEEHLRAGKYLVIAHGSAEEVERARHILDHSGVEELHLHIQPQPDQDKLSDGDQR
jgi:Heat induced stress protein YflT